MNPDDAPTELFRGVGLAVGLPPGRSRYALCLPPVPPETEARPVAYFWSTADAHAVAARLAELAEGPASPADDEPEEPTPVEPEPAPEPVRTMSLDRLLDPETPWAAIDAWAGTVTATHPETELDDRSGHLVSSTHLLLIPWMRPSIHGLPSELQGTVDERVDLAYSRVAKVFPRKVARAFLLDVVRLARREGEDSSDIRNSTMQTGPHNAVIQRAFLQRVLAEHPAPQ